MSDTQLKASSPAAMLLGTASGGRPVAAGGRRSVAGRLSPMRLRPRKLRQLLQFGPKTLFMLIVVLPTLAAGIYFYAIASDQYWSEAKFVVRSPTKQGASGLGAILQNSGISGTGGSESFAVIDFIKSRDALKEVDEKVNFREMVSRPGADFLARFPSMIGGDSFEELYEHYQNVVLVVHDAATSINMLRVRTFEPESSHRLAEALLQASEGLVNRMNERSLNDAVALASREVKTAEARSAAAQSALNAYRISVGQVDATSTSTSYLALIGGLEKELVAARAMLASTRSTSPNNPGIASLQDRVAAIENQVATEKSKLVGSDGGLVGTYGEFTKLTIEAEFASRALVAANTMLEAARVEALRKQLYLERVVEPRVADLSRYPRRLVTLLTVFGAALLVYAIVWLLVANAREHAS